MSSPPNENGCSALYRVYSCTSCPNIGFGRLHRRSDESVCSSCGMIIKDGPQHLYVDTLKRAGWAVQWTVFHRHEKDTLWDGRGLRSALSVFRIIEKKWRESKGRPLGVDSVVGACIASGMRETESRGSIGWLEADERIATRSGRVVEVLDREVHLPS